jgi:hypothetical protein
MKVECIKGSKYKYVLKEDYVYNFKYECFVEHEDDLVKLECHCITLKQGFKWDGATGISDKGLVLASAIHDALYHIIKKKDIQGQEFKALKDFADNTFRDVALEVGNTKLKSNIIFKGVQWFGGLALKIKK